MNVALIAVIHLSPFFSCRAIRASKTLQHMGAKFAGEVSFKLDVADQKGIKMGP